MNANSGIIIQPVDKDKWSDFEGLFQSKGAPGYCWCMAWRMNSNELKQNDSVHRKKFIKQRIDAGMPVGLLGYHENKPVAWCSVAPRDTYFRLGGDESLGKVWSLVCFYIRREFREKGFVHYFIESAREYAMANGALYFEAYPVEPDSPSYRHMGFRSTFEKAGFSFIKKAGMRRHVMVCKL